MNTKEILINNLDELDKLASSLSKQIYKNLIITLNGDLGAGKTTFTKYLGKYLNIKDNINSPTFTILKRYKGDIVLNHIDAYRIESSYDTDIEDYFYNNTLTIIEWSNKIKDILPNSYLEINISYSDNDTRIFNFNLIGDEVHENINLEYINK